MLRMGVEGAAPRAGGGGRAGAGGILDEFLKSFAGDLSKPAKEVERKGKNLTGEKRKVPQGERDNVPLTTVVRTLNIR